MQIARRKDTVHVISFYLLAKRIQPSIIFLCVASSKQSKCIIHLLSEGGFEEDRLN